MIWWFRKKKTPKQDEDDWPKFIGGNQPIIRWTHPEGKQRVYVVARADGTYSRWSEYFSEDPYEMCWVTEDAGASFYDSEETAIKEVHATYPWSKEIEPERRTAVQEHGDGPE